MNSNNQNQNRSRNKNRNRRPSNKNAPTGSLGHPKHQGNRRPSGKKKFQRGPDQNQNSLLKKYIYFLEQYYKARNELFEKFHRVEEKQRNHLNRVYMQSIERLRKFEGDLTPEQKEKLFLEDYKSKIITDYQSNSGESSLLPPSPPYADPHVKVSQRNRDFFNHDKEETVGTIEDYKKVKSL